MRPLIVIVLMCGLKVYAAVGMTGHGASEERIVEMPNLKDAGGPQVGLT
jgi:hypothetical protein